MRLAVQSFCALSAEGAASQLGITRQTADERRRAGTLLAVREGGDWCYPACQFREGGVIPGLTEVISGLAAARRWVTRDVLLAPDTTLRGRTPVQASRAGDRDAMLRLVRGSQGDGFA
jgi:hypothetical protein